MRPSGYNPHKLADRKKNAYLVKETMQPEELWRCYPLLYHIAWRGSWPSIKKYGLLSARELLRSWGKSNEEISELTGKRRPHWVEVHCPGRPLAIIRDQKPMTNNGLRTALQGSAEPRQWYKLISSMVFFWPTKKRLKNMLEASAYRELKHDVLIVCTKKLVELEELNIRLSRMNSGSTNRSHRRDMTLFKRIRDYPFESRRRNGKEGAIAEVCVKDRVADIQEAVIDVKCGSASEIMAQLTDWAKQKSTTI